MQSQIERKVQDLDEARRGAKKDNREVTGTIDKVPRNTAPEPSDAK